MLIGHFVAAFAAKRRAPPTNVDLLIAAAVLIPWAWWFEHHREPRTM